MHLYKSSQTKYNSEHRRHAQLRIHYNFFIRWTDSSQNAIEASNTHAHHSTRRAIHATSKRQCTTNESTTIEKSTREKCHKVAKAICDLMELYQFSFRLSVCVCSFVRIVAAMASSIHGNAATGRRPQLFYLFMSVSVAKARKTHVIKCI